MPIPVVMPWSSINTRADVLGRANYDQQAQVPVLLDYGGGSTCPSGRIALSLLNYSTHIYQYEDRTGMAYFYPTAFSQQSGSAGNVAPGTQVPDNPAWVGGPGNDAIFHVERRSTGECWSFWLARQLPVNAITLENLGAGIGSRRPTHVAGACIKVSPFSTSAPGRPADGHGMGIHRRALVLTAEEIQAAVADGRPIGHALGLTIANTWYGNIKSAVEGVDWLPPARRLEWDVTKAKNRPGYTAEKTRLTKEGFRIAVQLSAPERSAWLDRRVATSGPIREFARVVLDAICDYGLIVAVTGGAGMRVQTDGVKGPRRAIYQSLGIDVVNPAKHELLFAQLFVDHRSRVYAVRASH